jgi:hypothetical protein
MTDEEIDRDLDFMQDKITGHCPSCRQDMHTSSFMDRYAKHNPHSSNCVRNLTQIQSWNTIKFLSDYEVMTKLPFTGRSVLKCCKTDYEYLKSARDQSLLGLGFNINWPKS